MTGQRSGFSKFWERARSEPGLGRSIIAWMTRGERISRFVLAATLLLIVGGTAILWACHVNVRETLQRWERAERGKK